MVKKINKQQQVIRFLIVFFGLYLSWLLTYELLLRKHTAFDSTLVRIQTKIAGAFLSLAGSDFDQINEKDKSLMVVDGAETLYVGDDCNSGQQIVIFVLFIMASPGRFIQKIPFIALGAGIIILINIIRIDALVLIHITNPEWLDFNHKYTFNFMLNGMIILLWYLWFKHYAFQKES